MKIPCFCVIKLHLARTYTFPEGSDRHGYEILAPLTAEGRIDAQKWRDHASFCKVRRFWAGEEEMFGLLIHNSSSSKGSSWMIGYVSPPVKNHLGDPLFCEQGYVSIRDRHGDLQVFKVASIENLAQTA